MSLFDSPDGKYLVFISAKSAVDSGSHNATNSMHRIEWPADGKLAGSLDVADVVWDHFFNYDFHVLLIDTSLHF